jgi:hypothetical protein
MVERVADLDEVRAMAERLIEFHLGTNSDAVGFSLNSAAMGLRVMEIFKRPGILTAITVLRYIIQ